MRHESEASVRAWLETAWRGTRRVVIVEGGESDVPVTCRQEIETIADSEILGLLQEWTTAGSFAGDICRCPGDLALALLDGNGDLVGSASVHSDRVSWERARFQNDLIAVNMVELRLLFSRLGVDGSSRALLDRLISTLDLHEGEVQFRIRGDSNSLVSHVVPPSLAPDLLSLSGDEVAVLDDERVEQMARRLIEADGNPGRGVRQLLSWLGTATWPAEAVAGDGVLARRILGQFDDQVVMRILPDLEGRSEVMGAVVWAAFRQDDSAIMAAISPAVLALLENSE